MHWHKLQHRMEIARVVRGEPQFGTTFHGARELVERAGRYHAPLVVPQLRPRIREQDEDPAERRVRQSRQQKPRIVHENADVAEAAAAYLGQKLDDAVLEYLGAQESHLGMRRCLLGKVLAGAEADLEPKLGRRNGEEALRIETALLREIDPQLGQQRREEIALAGPQAPAAAPAVEDAPPCVGTRLRRIRQAKAERRLGTRSTRSQEKPPSASGWRPKWP